MQGHRGHQITEVVAHDERVAAFDAQLVEPGGFSKGEFAAFLNRSCRSLINELGEIYVFGIFGAADPHVAANELNLGSAAHFQIRIDGRAKVLRIAQRHVVAVNIKKELRDREAVELRAAADRKVATAERAGELFNLRLVRVEQDYSLKIRQRNSLIAEID